MRNLLITVGAPGSGKSTWIEENGLTSYTIAPDNLRLLLSSPQYNTDGTRSISAADDRKVWALLDETLEKRMSQGHFTVIDATHTREKYLKRYRDLCEKYRYRLHVKRFDVPLEELLNRNSNRQMFKKVPEDVIALHAERMKNVNIPASVKQIDSIEEINEIIRYEPDSTVLFEALYFIGDIQGCADQLKTFLDEHYRDDARYVFVGDYLDRGPKNAEVLKLLMPLAEKKNVTFLEGNHEKWLRLWANGDTQEITSREFILRTKPQLDSDIDKKDARAFCRKLRTFIGINYAGRNIFACHGGVSTPLPHFIASEQLVHGVGKYEELPDLYAGWPVDEKIVLVHGHRNIQKYPAEVRNNVFNLEGNVEFGGSLRVVKFSADGSAGEVIEYENIDYVPPETTESKIEEGLMDDAKRVDLLRASEYVREHPTGHISSFNFTRGAFEQKVWDTITTKTRGLFINTRTNAIVARSYNKFFNLDEVRETREYSLARHLEFPAKAYLKYNGFLGIVGYDNETDTVLYCSKAMIEGTHAQIVKEVLESLGISEEKLRNSPIMHGHSLIFEIVHPEKDPHIIKYQEPQAILLDVVANEWEFKKYSYEDTSSVAYSLGAKVKKPIWQFQNYAELSAWMKEFASESLEEGVVIEDAIGFQFKLKGAYYSLWKRLRSVKDRVHNTGIRISDFAFSAEALAFLAYLQTLEVEYIKSRSIIDLRDEFHSTQT